MVTKVDNLTSISGLGLPMSKVLCLHLACSQEKLVFELPGDKIPPAPLSQAQLILLCSLWQRNEQRGLACKTCNKLHPWNLVSLYFVPFGSRSYRLKPRGTG